MLPMIVQWRPVYRKKPLNAKQQQERQKRELLDPGDHPAQLLDFAGFFSVFTRFEFPLDRVRLAPVLRNTC